MQSWKFQDSFVRNVSVKISPKDFLPFMITYNNIYNKSIDICFDKKINNYSTLNAKTYSKFKKEYPDIPSNILQCISRNVIGNIRSSLTKYLKNNKLKRNDENIIKAFDNIKKSYKKQYSSIMLNSRNISLSKENILSYSSFLSLKRIKEKINIPNYFNKKYPNKILKCGTIKFDSKKQQFFAILCFEIISINPSKNFKVLGIDRGLNNIVYASNGFCFSSDKLYHKKKRYQYNRSKIQSKGTPSAKRCLKRLSGKEKRFDENVNHIISKQIANLPFNIFVLEDLSGILKQKYKGKHYNKLLNSWTFYQLEQFLIYKCQEKGKIVIKINPYMTSQKCNKCDYIDKNNRKGSEFRCLKCGHVEHADFNASKNIRDKFLLDPKKYIKDFDKFFQVEVNQPNGLSSKVSSNSFLSEKKKIDTINCNL